MPYVSGFLTPVKIADRDAYIAASAKAWPLFKKYGALQHVETWGDDIPPGKVTGFDLAVKLEAGEAVVFSWLRWPDKAAAEICFASMETDAAWQDMDMPFDGKRMMWGGFEVIFEG